MSFWASPLFLANPLGGVDASVVALAERLDTPLVLTLDRRDFAAVRLDHRESLELLPG